MCTKFETITYQEYIPKHIPHKPVSTVRRITHPMFPSHVTPNTAKENTNTMADCPAITRNWEATCEAKTSIPVIPKMCI